MSEYLVISAIGKDKPGIVNEISAVILNNQCNIDDSRMTVLGGEFALILLVSGNWNAINKLEELIPALALQSGMTIICKRTEPRDIKQDRIPYLVEVISIDHPGIVYTAPDCRRLVSAPRGRNSRGRGVGPSRHSEEAGLVLLAAQYQHRGYEHQ